MQVRSEERHGRKHSVISPGGLGPLRAKGQERVGFRGVFGPRLLGRPGPAQVSGDATDHDKQVSLTRLPTGVGRTSIPERERFADRIWRVEKLMLQSGSASSGNGWLPAEAPGLVVELHRSHEMGSGRNLDPAAPHEGPPLLDQRRKNPLLHVPRLPVE